MLKQQLVSRFDYSILSIFRMIDKYGHGKLNADNLRIFLAKFECSSELEHSDITNWIKRFDRDVDGGLNFVDVVNALQTLTNYAPKRVDKANDISRLQNEQREELLRAGLDSRANSTTMIRMDD